MPLGNLTSQFFANVYLNELDQFVKHKLKAKFYIRYVDDFVILHHSGERLTKWKEEIDKFLKDKLKIELHEDKSKVLKLNKGIGFLGFRIFFHHKLIKKKNINHFKRKFRKLFDDYRKGLIQREKIIEILQGWLAYASHADTFKYRKRIIKIFGELFTGTYSQNSQKLIDEKKYNYINDIEYKKIKLTHDKSFYLLKKRLSVKEIAVLRNIKEGTVWNHMAKLIQEKSLTVFDVLPRKKVFKILSKIKSEDDKLKNIKERLNSISITYNEIDCVLAMIKSSKKNRND